MLVDAVIDRASEGIASWGQVLAEVPKFEVGPGAGYHLKEVKIGPIKLGGGIVFASGGVGVDNEGLYTWGRATADIEASVARFGGRAYLYDVDIDRSGINNVDILGAERPEWDYSIGAGLTVSPYSAHAELDFNPVVSHARATVNNVRENPWLRGAFSAARFLVNAWRD